MLMSKNVNNDVNKDSPIVLSYILKNTAFFQRTSQSQACNKYYMAFNRLRFPAPTLNLFELL